MGDFGTPTVRATGSCGKCGAAIQVKARPPDGPKDYVDVRCGTCGGLTTADEFQPISERRRSTGGDTP